MGGISLTASMRSNLLSLQNISGQVSSTQNKLATGNKVNSAIDNPSSYYTALSLNNRADDLNALLDSMGQAVSTIKAATTALESATEFLEQASAVATQALETAKIPSKSFFEEKVGENGAVVTTAQELRDAINAGKETICVYGAIDLGDISQTGGLTLQENQKLVGVGYFGNYDTDTNKFSSITATADADREMITLNGNNTIISDLSINYTNKIVDVGASTIKVKGGENEQHCTKLNNLDINARFENAFTNIIGKSAIYIDEEAIADITGKMNISAYGSVARGIVGNRSTINIHTDTQLNIATSGAYGYGIRIQQANLNVFSSANITIQTQGENGLGISCYLDGLINIAQSSDIYISASRAQGISLSDNSSIDISGNMCIYTGDAHCLTSRNSIINIKSTAQIYFAESKNFSAIYNNANMLNVATGAKLAFAENDNVHWYNAESDYSTENNISITADNVKDKLNVEETTAWELPEKVEIDFEDGNSNGETAKQDLTDAGRNYQEIINQYDALIKDAGYKGINLLQADKLTVKFNETNTADLSVQGQDMSSQALGFKTFDWQTQADIADSLAEIANALQSIRNYSSELGNNYSIITTRQDFTESLVNVLTEGADKLTLADMNEESANMLALQTRQQLAINSLSLASQASQSILKLF